MKQEKRGPGKLAVVGLAFMAFVAIGHGKHHHLGIPSLDSFGTAPVGSPETHSAIVHLGYRIATRDHHWRGVQHTCLNELWTQESNWNPNAQNPHSTAYGIAQFLDTTWAGYGPKTSNARTQIVYGEDYIRNRYGTPCAAEDHERAQNWY